MLSSSTFAGLVALTTLAPGVLAACNRTALLEFADAYVFAHENGCYPDPLTVVGSTRDTYLLSGWTKLACTKWTIGQVSNLENIAENFTYVENNKTHEITSGIFNNAFKIDHRHTIADEVECATYTELIITHNASGAATPHVIGTQIRHNAADMSCYLIDLLVSGPGSWLFNASQTLYWAQRENWAVIAEPARDTREALRAAADAYLDMWSDKDAAAAVPWGTPCARLEGSAYTGTGGPNDSCKPGIPTNSSQAPNSHRRYVIDESYGSIDVMCIFEHLANAPDSHEFRLENGKLRYVHTITLADSAVVHP